MFKSLKEFFMPPTTVTPEDRRQRLLQASAALLLEMQWADHEPHGQELATIRQLLGKTFMLDAAACDELIALAAERRDRAVSLYEFTSQLNQWLNEGEKHQLIAMLWRTAYADGVLHKQEEALLRQIADLLYVPHADFIRIKLAVAD
jgi:uncharacterized tellurite resistance protein B-like protein